MMTVLVAKTYQLAIVENTFTVGGNRVCGFKRPNFDV